MPTRSQRLMQYHQGYDAQGNPADWIEGGVAPPDTTGPILTLPSGIQTGTTTATVGVTTNEGGGLLRNVCTTSVTVPDAEYVLGGMDHLGAAAPNVFLSTTVPGNKSANVTGLAPATVYYPYFAQEDAAGNLSNVAAGAPFITAALADTTAPILSLPTGAATGTTTATVGATTNENNGALRAVNIPSATPPSQDQIIAGQDGAGVDANASVLTITSIGAKTMPAVGLSEGSTYYSHMVQVDLAGNKSNIVSSGPFTTAVAGVVGEFFGSRFFGKTFFGRNFFGPAPMIPPAPPSLYGTGYEPGWVPALDEGTTADYFVDSSRPDDSGVGTTLATAKKTITAAMALPVAGKTIKVKDNGQPYRETVTFTGKGGSSDAVRTRLIGYGAGKPTISGAEVITGFVPCVSGDAPIVGPNWASVWKKTGIAKTEFVDNNPAGMNLYEDGTAMNEAIDRAINTEPFLTQAPSTWWEAEEIYSGGDGASKIVTLVNCLNTTNGSPTVTINYTAHGLATGGKIKLSGFSDTGGLDFASVGSSGTVRTITVVNANSFTYNHGANATSTVANGGGDGTLSTMVAGIKDTSITDKYTSAQILRSSVFFTFGANHTARSTILDFNGTTKIIHVTNDVLTYLNTNPPGKYWAMINILPAIAPGGYGFAANAGDPVNLVDVYVWPTNVANLTSKIEYSKRKICIDLNQESNIEIASLRVKQASDTLGLNNGNGIRTGSTATPRRTFVTVRNVYSSDHYSLDTGGYGAIYLGNIDGIRVTNVTIENVRGMFGMFIAGGDNIYVRNVDVIRVENSPLRFYGTTNAIVVWNRCADSSADTHANKMNFYEGCRNVLVWGCQWLNNRGYFTYQECDTIFVGFCQIPNGPSTLAIVDQNHGTLSPLIDLTDSMFFNITAPPDPISGITANNVTFGEDSNPLVKFRHYNNIFHGDSSVESQMVDRDYNVLTLGSVVGAHSIAAALADVYTDYTIRDYSIKATGPVYSKVGKNMMPRITSELIPRFGSRFNEWDRDLYGNQFNWADAPIGAYRARPMAADLTNPTLLLTIPGDGVTGVNPSATLTMVFSEDVVAGSGNVKIYKASDNSLIQTRPIIAATITDATVVMPLSAPLAAGTAYYVNYDAGIVRDLSGNGDHGLAGSVAWNFTTASSTDINWVGGAFGGGSDPIDLSVNIGTAATRSIIVLVGFEGGANITSVVVDPTGENVTLTAVGSQIGPSGVTTGQAMFRGTVSGGGTKVIRVDHSAGQTGCAVSVYEVAGTLSNQTLFAGGTSGSASQPVTGSNTVPVNGIMIAGYTSRTPGAANIFSRSDLAAVTRNYSASAAGGTVFEFATFISKAVTGVSTTFTAKGVASAQSAIAAAWTVS